MLRVLLLDDDPATIEAVATFFEKFEHGHGYAVSAAGTGAEAAEALRRGRPDLLIVDVQMKGLDGLALLKQIKTLDRTIPVIVLAGREDSRCIGDALTAGAFAYAPKPCEFVQLEHLVGLVLTAAAPV